MTLPYSKYSSPIFAQRKPNGKLRILVDLRRINHLLKNDYNQHNHPVTTIADAAQHMAGKKYFCKLDCSQAYHCLQMADEQCIQLKTTKRRRDGTQNQWKSCEEGWQSPEEAHY